MDQPLPLTDTSHSNLNAAMIGQFILQLSPIPSNELVEFISKCGTLASYAKGEYFTKSGDIQDYVGFIVEGIFRVYYLDSEGAKHIRNFCCEGMPVGSYATTLQGQPANVFIEAIENVQVLRFQFRDLASRFEGSWQWERLGRRIAEQHYIKKELREYELLTKTALERYVIFRATFPGLEARISQLDVAAYLGIRPESLSRLRKQLQDSKKSSV